MDAGTLQSIPLEESLKYVRTLNGLMCSESDTFLQKNRSRNKPVYFVTYHIGSYSGIKILAVLKWWLRLGTWEMAGLGSFPECEIASIKYFSVTLMGLTAIAVL